MAYLRYLLSAAATVMALVAALNYFVDPASVYFYEFADSKDYVQQLVAAPHGLWWPNNSFEERRIKKALTYYSRNVPCVVIGSSRAMLIGSARKNPTLVEVCPAILNLAVRSAGIEDIFALSYLAVKNGPPRKIVLEMDPWTFSYGVGPRWVYYASDYEAALRVTGAQGSTSSEKDSNHALAEKLKNILSLDYTMQSFQQAAADIRYGGSRFAARRAPVVNRSQGWPHQILFRDGSLLYASEIETGPTAPVKLGGDYFSVGEHPNDPHAIAAFMKLLRWLRAHHVEPILLLTPFHPNVWKFLDTDRSKAMVAAEPIIRQLGKEMNIRVIGTYDPARARCAALEFYDSLHVRTQCLAKLQ